MARSLQPRQGLTAPKVTSIPNGPLTGEWFRSFITNYMNPNALQGTQGQAAASSPTYVTPVNSPLVGTGATVLTNLVQYPCNRSMFVPGLFVQLPGPVAWDVNANGGIVDIIFGTSGAFGNGYLIRFNAQAGQSSAGIWKISGGAPGAGPIGAQVGPNNGAALSGTYRVVAVFGVNGAMSVYVDDELQWQAVDATYTLNGSTYLGYAVVPGPKVWAPTAIDQTLDYVADSAAFQRMVISGAMGATDLPYNGKFTQYAAGQSFPDGWQSTETSGAGITIQRVTGGYNGSPYAVSMGPAAAGNGGGICSQLFGVQPGMRYRLRAVVQSNVANPASLYVRMMWFSNDPAASNIGANYAADPSYIGYSDTVESGGPTTANTWTGYDGTVVAPPSARYAVARIYNWTSASNPTIIVGQVSVAALVSNRYNFGNGSGAAAWMHVGTLTLNAAGSATFVWHAGAGYNTNANQQSIVTWTIRAGDGTAAPNLAGITGIVSGGTNPVSANTPGNGWNNIMACATNGSTSPTNTSWEIYAAVNAYSPGLLDVTLSSENGDGFVFSGVATSAPSNAANTFVGTDPAWAHDYTGRIATGRGALSPAGSVNTNVPGLGISYTTTTTTANFTAGANTAYYMDGTTAPTAALNYSVTGLTASTTYHVYPFLYQSGGNWNIAFAAVAGGVGSGGSMYTSPSATAAQLANNFQYIPLGSFTFSTPASGSGGGGGDQFGCLHPNQWVELANGEWCLANELELGMLLPSPNGPAPIRLIRREDRNAWALVTFSNDTDLLVTLDHRFIQPDGEEVRARDLTLGKVIAGRNENTCVTELKLYEDRDSMVSIELAAPHTYYLNGLLSHNVKP